MIWIATGFAVLVLVLGLAIAGVARAKKDEARDNGETD